MRQALTPARNIFVHDFDGVHTQHHAHPDINDFFNRMQAYAALDYFPDLSFAEAKKLGMESYNAHNDGLKVFFDKAANNPNLSDDYKIQVKDGLHASFNRHSWIHMQDEKPEIFARCEETIQLFEILKNRGVRHALLTQSCLKNWAFPAFDLLGTRTYFEALHGFKESGCLTKTESTQPLHGIMTLMNAAPKQTVFVEDSPRNLLKAKELSGDILTAFIYPKKPLEECPDYIDIQVPSLRELLKLRVDVEYVPQAYLLQDNRAAPAHVL